MVHMVQLRVRRPGAESQLQETSGGPCPGPSRGAEVRSQSRAGSGGPRCTRSSPPVWEAL